MINYVSLDGKNIIEPHVKINNGTFEYNNIYYINGIKCKLITTNLCPDVNRYNLYFATEGK